MIRLKQLDPGGTGVDGGMKCLSINLSKQLLIELRAMSRVVWCRVIQRRHDELER